EAGEPRGVAQADAAAGRGVRQRLELGERELERRGRGGGRLQGTRLDADQPPRRRPAERKEERDALACGERVERAGLEWAVGLDVAQHEALRVGAALERDAGALAHAAVRAVAAGEVEGAHVLDAAVVVAQRAPHVPLA